MDLPVLYEDDRLLVIDKPAGLLVIPGRGEDQALSVVSMLREQRGERLFVVHRLDRGTSGVLLFARDEEAHRRLCGALEARQAEKRYLALVALGDVSLEEPKFIDAAIAPARRGRMRLDVRGKDARTLVRLVERLPPYALVEAVPETGRTHQIRLHLIHLGAPLAVDPQYHAPRALLWQTENGIDGRMSRTPLHAAHMRFPHPDGKRFLTVEAPLAGDIAACVEHLRRGGRVVEER